MKPFTMAAMVVFSLIAIVQLVRVLMGWPVTVNGVNISPWVSGIAFVVAGGLAVMLWREHK